MSRAQSLKDLMRIRAHKRAFLDSINSNLGTALGFKKPTDGELTDEPAIIVFVPMKINPKWLPQGQQIPKELEGPDGLRCPLDVVEGASAEKEDPVARDVSEVAERLRGWDDQIWAGSQLGHWTDQSKGMYSVGTLGAFAENRVTGANGLLTNQHVGIAPGQKLYHPVPWGTHIATTQQVIEYVEDQDYYGPFVRSRYPLTTCQ